jgi:peptidoglycan/LPS O-acetylase OafA/YrhL
MIVLIHSTAYFRLPPMRDVLQLTQGVSFFFVLSGFILAYNYEAASRRSWGAFFAARIARIWPAHLVVLVAYFGLASPFGAIVDPATRATVLVANAFLVHAWVPFQEFFFSFNAVSWSLSTELGFYLIFPLLVRGRSGSLPWTALAISLAMAAGFVLLGTASGLTLIADASEPSLLGIILVNPLARLFEFTLGIFACAVYRQWTGDPGRLWIVFEVGALLFVAVCMHAFTEGRMESLPPALGYYLVWAGSAPAFAALIIVFAASHGPLARLLSATIFTLLGEISFCLYLVHQPILAWIAEHRALPVDGTFGVAVYWLACLIVSLAAFTLVERPARLWLLSRWRPDVRALPGRIDVVP